MAEHNVNEQAASSVESTDRGLFDFMKKKEEQKPQEETLVADFEEKVQVSEPEPEPKPELKIVEEEKKHGGLLEKLHRSDSSSSSSSSDEEDDEEKKKRKKEKKEKKGLKEKLKEKLPGHKDNEEDTNIPIEKCDEHDKPNPNPHVQEVVYSEPSHPETDPEKKGFLDKIKDKLPGQKKTDELHEVATPVVAEPSVEVEGKDKKGFLEKIKEKIPGFSSKGGEDKKDKNIDDENYERH